MVDWPYNGRDGWRIDDTMVALDMISKFHSLRQTNEPSLPTTWHASLSPMQSMTRVQESVKGWSTAA